MIRSYFQMAEYAFGRNPPYRLTVCYEGRQAVYGGRRKSSDPKQQILLVNRKKRL